MKNKNQKNVIRHCRKSFISIILLILNVYGQSIAQWENTNLPSTEKVNTLAISNSNIFAGTNGDGIFLSTDNGENWISINDGLQSKVVHTIFINGARIFAGTETGASISTDYGVSWNTINSGLSGLGVWSLAVSINEFGDTTIYAGTWRGVYASTNNGKNWEARNLSDATMPVHSIVLYDQFIFAATLAGGVFSSQHNGYSWDDFSITEHDYDAGIETLIPVYSLAIIDTIVIAGAGAGYIYYKVYNDDGSFRAASTISQYKAPILCFAVRNANFFAGNSDGLFFYSENDGLTWWVMEPDLAHQEVYSLALNNSYIFAGTENGVWRLWYPETNTNVDNLIEAPTWFALEQNYPNPFNPSTKIRFTIPVGCRVSIKVYNILGKLVDNLVDRYVAPGTYEVVFSPIDLPSGIYFYTLVTNEFRGTRKLILMK